MPIENEKLKKISDELNEHIIAVRGTLELVEASTEEDELQGLLSKAIERIDILQKLSGEILAALTHCLEKIKEK